MIRSFQHKGLETFFRSGTKEGIQPAHAAKLRILLTALDFAKRAEDMSAPGWRLHPLKGELKGFYSVTVNGNWRIIFRVVNAGVELLDYLDYH